jgi:hypothetical protein
MTVVIDDAALAALFQSQPLELEVERVARVVEQRVIDNLTTGPSPYLHRNPALANDLVGFSIKRDQEGVFAQLGFMDIGLSTLPERLANKELAEHKWIGAAIQEPI